MTDFKHMNDSEAFWFIFLSNRVVLEWKLILKSVNHSGCVPAHAWEAYRAEDHHLSQSVTCIGINWKTLLKSQF